MHYPIALYTVRQQNCEMIGVLKKVNFIVYFKRKLIQYGSALYLVEQVDIVLSLYVRSNWYQIQHIETVHILCMSSLQSQFLHSMHPFPSNILNSCTNYCWLTDSSCLEPYSCEPGTVFWVPLYWSVVRFLISSQALHCWRPLTIHVVDGLSAGSSIGFGLAVVINIYLFCLAALRFPALSVGVCCRERNIEVLDHWFNKIINFTGI